MKRASAVATYALAVFALTGCLGDDEPIDAAQVAAATNTAQGTAPTPTAARPPSGGSSTNAAGTKSVVINWTAPTEYEDGSPFIDLAGYRIWYGRTPGSYSNLVDIAPGTTSYKVHSLGAATYYFSITAYNHDGVESALSNELMIKLN